MNKAIKKQIKELGELKLPELWARYAEIVGEETKAPNKTYLIRRIVATLENRAAREEMEEAESEAALAEQVDTDEVTTAMVEQDDTEAHSSEEPTSSTLPTIDELREKYREIVGRDTGSHDRRYLLWKIRQAEQGKIPVGPARTRSGDGVGREFKVLPVRMEADLVDKLDEAWKRQGLRSRMELFRVSLQAYLVEVGEGEVAEMLCR